MIKLMDLFCGCGGMTLGFLDQSHAVKVTPILAIDIDKDSVATYNANFGAHALCQDIETFAQNAPIPQADVVIGGPPCQGFSLLNKKRGGDARRSLWKPFLDMVEKSAASIFVIENVKELHGALESRDISDHANRLGFTVFSRILNAADYGVPQIRNRTIIIGLKNHLGPSRFLPPIPTNSTDGLEKPKWRTVREAISDLPEPTGTEINSSGPPLDLHFGRNPTQISLSRYKLIPSGGNRFDLAKNAPELTPRCWLNKKSGSTDLFGRLRWDRPSVTIRTEFFKPEKGRYLHPDQDRPITHREAARLMGFPDSFLFSGNKTSIAKQIGNAVPPLLAKSIASSLYPLFK
ncbi:MAG: DNA cytosine methyltransferase [Deltaproteobacteria bacterium]|jgi:DNA (cytosine-5)-methyltransferase 1|nr:DNA cytosine methyltransferase [Deltaproteobacteria bacterium]